MAEPTAFTGDGSRLRMGLRRLDWADWTDVDLSLAADLAEKRRLLTDRHDEVVAVVDDPDGSVRAAATELLERLADHLVVRSPATHVRQGAVVSVADDEVPVDAVAVADAGLHPVEAAGRLTQEDWCVHLPDADGRWRLVAASVCFPTRWVLRSKIGRTVREIHAPVAFYDEQLADPVDAFFARFARGDARWRLNWNLMHDPALHQPVGKFLDGLDEPLDAASAGERIWLRTERQTLVRLPSTGAVVFGIRILQQPLGSLAGDPARLALLRDTLRTMPDRSWDSRSFRAYGEAVLGWIDERLRTA